MPLISTLDDANNWIVLHITTTTDRSIHRFAIVTSMPNGWHNLHALFRLDGIGAGLASYTFQYIFRTCHAKMGILTLVSPLVLPTVYRLATSTNTGFPALVRKSPRQRVCQVNAFVRQLPIQLGLHNENLSNAFEPKIVLNPFYNWNGRAI
jgi:hypothetical protein